MGFQEICEDVVKEAEGALGCLLMDLRTGLTLASAQRPGAALDEAEIKSVLRSGEDMFRGKLIDQYARLLPSNRRSAAGFVREVQITTAYTYQFMAAIPGWDNGVVFLITEKDLSLGLGWMTVHRAQELFAESRRSAPQGERGSIADPARDQMPPGGYESAPHAPRQSATPVPPMPSMPVQAPMPRQAPAARDQAPVTPAPERPPPPAAGAAPVPPPRQAPIPEPVSAPPVARERSAEPAAAVDSEAENDDQPEIKRRVPSGPRAKMFKPRPSKK